ncbi:hypothetical protein NFI96_020562 [Prochilodus magdalenae]|nr:hypothetical protein NFI96_020562 [Prochilodus magdalenae]
MLRTVTKCLLTNPVAGRRMMSQSSLAGKVAIVTASTDGIGLATAKSLGKRGAHVVVSSRRQANVDKAVSMLRSENIQVTGTSCNVGNKEDREKLINMTLEQCGGIDILVSNAAVNPFFGNILESTEEVWNKVEKYITCECDSSVPFDQTSGASHGEKRKRLSGVGVLSSRIPANAGKSTYKKSHHKKGLGPYSVSKTALLGLTRALAPELAQSNIRINCVAPGIIKTRFSSALWQSEDVTNEFMKQLSIKRLGKPEDIGDVVAFLCSDEASYITGETITVTGGINCRL